MLISLLTKGEPKETDIRTHGATEGETYHDGGSNHSGGTTIRKLRPRVDICIIYAIFVILEAGGSYEPIKKQKASCEMLYWFADMIIILDVLQCAGSRKDP